MIRLLLALTLALLTLLPANASSRYWVVFKDRGYTTSDLSACIDSLNRNWPARSLSRRQRAGASISENDLPLSTDYVQQLRTFGCSIGRESRWLNAVSVTATAGSLQQVRSLPFVESVRSVCSARIESVPSMAEVQAIVESVPGKSAVSWGAYGPSWRQAWLSRVIEAHDRGLTGKGVLIGMLDSGFQLDHRAFAGLRLVAQYDFIFNDPDPSWDPETDPSGQASHGTACLSVIGGYDPGHLVGIAPEASFALGKSEFTGAETQSEEDDWVAGIEWLEMLGADVVSSSLGYRDWYRNADLNGETPLVSRAAQRAAELGMVVVVSAGNAGPKLTTLGAPADARDVIAVAAADSTGSITRFSSRGPTADGRIKPDVAAMGRKVVCVSPMTFDRYARWNGTSLACPIVAGIAALVIEAHPDWSPDRVREALRMTASKAFMPDDSTGYGLVDCIGAIDYPSIAGRFKAIPSGRKAQVLLLSRTGGEVERKALDPSGWYRFPNVPNGEYSIQVQCGDSLLFRRDGLVVPPGMEVVIGK